MLDFAGNGEWFDEGHSCAGCETVAGENGHGPIEKEGVLIVSAVDEWISRAWLSAAELKRGYGDRLFFPRASCYLVTH